MLRKFFVLVVSIFALTQECFSGEAARACRMDSRENIAECVAAAVENGDGPQARFLRSVLFVRVVVGYDHHAEPYVTVRNVVGLDGLSESDFEDILACESFGFDPSMQVRGYRGVLTIGAPAVSAWGIERFIKERDKEAASALRARFVSALSRERHPLTRGSRSRHVASDSACQMDSRENIAKCMIAAMENDDSPQAKFLRSVLFAQVVVDCNYRGERYVSIRRAEGLSNLSEVDFDALVACESFGFDPSMRAGGYQGVLTIGVPSVSVAEVEEFVRKRGRDAASMQAPELRSRFADALAKRSRR